MRMRACEHEAFSRFLKKASSTFFLLMRDCSSWATHARAEE